MPHSVHRGASRRSMPAIGGAYTKRERAQFIHAANTRPGKIEDYSPSLSEYSVDELLRDCQQAMPAEDANHTTRRDSKRDSPMDSDSNYRGLRDCHKSTHASLREEFKASNAKEVSPDVMPEDWRKRSQYFEQQSHHRNQLSGAMRECVQRDSPVIAELRTNIIVKDEYGLVTDLSYHLSNRFARPESSIMINVDHSACLLLGGSFEPAYILTVNALPSQLHPSANKRNAALIQAFMEDILTVPAERGIIRFVSIAEDDLATNSMTIAGEISRLEQLAADDMGNGGGAHSRSSSSSKHAQPRPLRKSSLAVQQSKPRLVERSSSSIRTRRSSVTSLVSDDITPPLPLHLPRSVSLLLPTPSPDDVVHEQCYELPTNELDADFMEAARQRSEDGVVVVGPLVPNKAVSREAWAVQDRPMTAPTAVAAPVALDLEAIPGKAAAGQGRLMSLSAPVLDDATKKVGRRKSRILNVFNKK